MGEKDVNGGEISHEMLACTFSKLIADYFDVLLKVRLGGADSLRCLAIQILEPHMLAVDIEGLS